MGKSIRTVSLLMLASSAGLLGACNGYVANNDPLAESSRDVTGITCDGKAHWVDVPGTQCLDGSATGFEYICNTGSAAGPLLIYFDGGGACWDYGGCDCQPDVNGFCQNPNATIFRNSYHKQQSDDGRPWSQTSFGQSAAFAGFTSGFNTAWNIVRIPYCTGDVHAGNNIVTLHGITDYTVHFKGFSNTTLDVAQIATRFPTPSKIALWGASAGGLGVDCNLGKVRTQWSVPMYAMNNAGPPLSVAYDPGVPTIGDAYHWGIWRIQGGSALSNTCPFDPIAPNTPWQPIATMLYNNSHYASVRKALTDDYHDCTGAFFASVLGGDPNQEPGLSLTYVFNNAINGNANYKAYYHGTQTPTAGYCHSERETDSGVNACNQPDTSCNYDGMAQNSVSFNNWVRGWLGIPGYTWDNVL